MFTSCGTSSSDVLLRKAPTRVRRESPSRAQTAPVLRPHRPGDLGWMIQSQTEFYVGSFGWNGHFEALVSRLTEGGRLSVDIAHKTDDKGVETSEVLLDIQPLLKKERGAKSEPAEPEEATAD